MGTNHSQWTRIHHLLPAAGSSEGTTPLTMSWPWNHTLSFVHLIRIPASSSWAPGEGDLDKESHYLES